MPQFARPDADIVDGAWLNDVGSAVDMFQSLDETSSNDADFVESELNPSASAVAFGLSDVEDPQVSTGHIVRYRYQKDATGGNQIDLVVELRQGYISEVTQGTLIHSEAHTNIPNGWTAGTFTLSAVEADSITDYNDLQLRMSANQV